MMVRSSTVLALVFATFAVLSQLAHAEETRPSRETLRQMGLGGLVVMSDEEATAIRGQGYAAVFGTSFASIATKNGMASTEHAYAAEGKHFAAGGTHSKAEATKKSVHIGHGGFGLWIHSTKVSAHGGAWAASF